MVPGLLSTVMPCLKANPLRGRTTAQERLDAAKAVLLSFAEDVEYERSVLLERHANDFNAAELDPPAGLFEDGPPERRTIKIKNGQTVDYAQLSQLLKDATATIAP